MKLSPKPTDSTPPPSNGNDVKPTYDLLTKAAEMAVKSEAQDADEETGSCTQCMTFGSKRCLCLKSTEKPVLKFSVSAILASRGAAAAAAATGSEDEDLVKRESSSPPESFQKSNSPSAEASEDHRHNNLAKPIPRPIGSSPIFGPGPSPLQSLLYRHHPYLNSSKSFSVSRFNPELTFLNR